jgi:hypothetical protein
MKGLHPSAEMVESFLACTSWGGSQKVQVAFCLPLSHSVPLGSYLSLGLSFPICKRSTLDGTQPLILK